jgi:acyl carrier protein
VETTEIEHEVRTFLEQNFLQGGELGVRDDQPLLGTVIDSQGVIELVTFLQERFGISVEDEEVTTTNLESVRQAVAFVERKLKKLALDSKDS